MESLRSCMCLALFISVEFATLGASYAEDTFLMDDNQGFSVISAGSPSVVGEYQRAGSWNGRPEWIAKTGDAKDNNAFLYWEDGSTVNAEKNPDLKEFWALAGDDLDSDSWAYINRKNSQKLPLTGWETLDGEAPSAILLARGTSECFDKAPVEICERRKAKGHCESGEFTKWAYKMCKETCGLCGCTDSPRWKDQDGDGCNWWRDYCVDGAVDAEEWTADDLEFYDFPQKHCCGCGRADGTGPCEPDPCNKLGNTGEVCAAVDNDATCNCGTEPCLAGERCLAGVCVQCTSMANGARYSGNDRCRWYARGQNWRECGDYDDEDFTANEMCCECGGGSIAA